MAVFRLLNTTSTTNTRWLYYSQEHEFGVGTIAGVVAKFGVHRRMVRQAIAGALPPPRRYPARVKPKLDAVAAFIDQLLDKDRRAPRKQRHTARLIYRRILTAFPDALSGVDRAQLCPGSKAGARVGQA